MASRYESDRTRKEKRELEKEKLSTMNWKGKLEYIWAYYKAAIFGVIGFFVLIGVLLNIYENSKYEDILSIGVANSAVIDSTETTEKKLLELFGSGDKYERVNVDTSYTFGDDLTTADSNIVMKFTTIIAAQGMDVFLCNKEIFEAYDHQDMFEDLSELLSEEQCERYGISRGDRKLDVTNLVNYQDLELTYYEPVYLAVPTSSQHMDYAAKFIEYLEEGVQNE